MQRFKIGVEGSAWDDGQQESKGTAFLAEHRIVTE